MSRRSMTRWSSRKGTLSDECGAMSSGHDKTEGKVETMMTADSLQLAAYGPGEDQIHGVEGGSHA